MRKIYLTTIMTLAVGFSFAQLNESFRGIQAKPTSDVFVPEVNFSDEAIDRGTSAFWTEDFSNGFASSNGTWTTDGTEGSIWKQDFYGSSGCWSFNTATPAFTTTANGFMLFDADSANCVDASTTPPTFTQDVVMGGLISPDIDVSGQATVLLTFQQTLRYCCSAALTLYVYVSNDGGNTWSTPINVLYGLAVNAQAANPQTVSVNITNLIGAGSSTNGRIKFEWNGVSHYYWAIDDIMLTPAPANDVRLNSVVFYNETYDPIVGVPVDFPVTTANQIDNVVFKSELDNQGSATAFNANIDMSVENVATTVVATGNSTPADLASASTRMDSVVWSHNATPDTYTINLTADHDDIGLEAITTDNDKMATIITTPATGAGAQYGRDNNIATGSGLWNQAGNGFIMGSTFSIYNTATLISIDVVFTPSTDPGVSACVILYEIDPSTGDFIPLVDQCLDGVEYTLSNSHISTNSTMVWNRFPINPTNVSAGYSLAPGQYIAAISHYGGPQDMVIQAGGTTPGNLSVWLFDQTDATWYYMTTKPKIRMGFDATASMIVNGVGIEEGEMTNMSLSQNSPNPANGITTIGYSLWEAADVTFNVVDVTGKVVYSQNMGNKAAGVYNIQLNTADYASGVYYYTLTAGTETMTKKMVITE